MPVTSVVPTYGPTISFARELMFLLCLSKEELRKIENQVILAFSGKCFCWRALIVCLQVTHYQMHCYFLCNSILRFPEMACESFPYVACRSLELIMNSGRFADVNSQTGSRDIFYIFRSICPWNHKVIIK